MDKIELILTKMSSHEIFKCNVMERTAMIAEYHNPKL